MSTQTKSTSVHGTDVQARQSFAPLGQRAEILSVWAIVALAATLRFPFLAWGLPGGLHPDEWVVTESAVDMARRNSFEPDIYLRPNHLEIRLSYLLYQAYAQFIARQPAEIAFAESPDPFLVMSRAVTALFALLLVFFGYLAGRRFGQIAGLSAAFVLAVHPIFVEHSLYATPDVPLAAMVMLVALALVRYVSAPTYLNLALASLGASLGVAIKYPGALSTIMIAIVVTLVSVRDRDGIRWLRHAVFALGSTVGLLFALSPNLFTNMSAVMSAIESESRTTHAGADGLSYLGKIAYYLGGFAESSGVVLTSLAATGLVLVVRKRKLSYVPLAIGVVYLLVLSGLGLHWERWATPMYVSFVLLAALAAQSLAQLDISGVRPYLRRFLRLAALSFVALGATGLLLSSLSLGVRLNAPDTRLISMETADSVGADASNTLYEGYTPMFPNGRRVIFDQLIDAGSTVIPADPGTRFVVLSTQNHGRYFRDDRYVSERQTIERIQSDYELLARVSPSLQTPSRQLLEPMKIATGLSEIVQVISGASVGPVIEFWKVP